MVRCRTSHSGWPIRRLVPSFVVSALVLLLLLLSPASARADELRGRVRDPHDRPVRSAEVLIVQASGARIAATARTDADGRFGPLTLPPGEYVILVVAPGLRSTRPLVTVRTQAATDVDVALVTSAVSESIVVSAAQVDTPLSRVTDSVTVEDATSLRLRQVETVAEAIGLTPGFGVINSGGRGAITSFFPRGGESDYTLVLVDGVPQNAFGGGFDAAHLSAADVDRIEIVRGPQSALYGGGAIGGLVHVLTRSGGPLRARGVFEGGSHATWRAEAGAAGSRGPWAWGGTIDRLMTDGSRASVPGQGTVSNDDYRRVAASGNLAWSDGPARRIRFDLRGGQAERGFPGPFGADPLDRYSAIDTVSRGTTQTLQTALSAVFGSATSSRHTAVATFADLQGRFISPGFTPGSNFESEDRSRRITARYQFDLERHRAGITAGAELVRERADNTFVTGSTFDEIPIERLITGLFVEGRPRLGDRLFVTAGLRAERIERRALDGDGFSRPTFDADTVWSVNPKLSVAWYVRRPGSGAGFFAGSTRIRGGAGTGIKPPTTFEIGFTDNPGLKPERSRSVDLGLEQTFAGGAFVVDATWFANRFDDLIVFLGSGLEPQPVSLFRSDNIANARASGVELGASGRMAGGLSIRGAWTFLDTEVLALDGAPGRAPSPFDVGDPLIRRPRHQGSIAIMWSGGRTSAFVTIHGRGRMADLEPNFGAPVFESAAYTTTTLGGAFRIAMGLEVHARVSNLFDRAYEDTLGFPALGRSAMVGLRIAAGR